MESNNLLYVLRLNNLYCKSDNRLAGGEVMVNLPPLIKYLYYDEDTEFQLFPFRTLAMTLSLISLLIVSQFIW